jgi:hypothetical protein
MTPTAVAISKSNPKDWHAVAISSLPYEVTKRKQGELWRGVNKQEQRPVFS